MSSKQASCVGGVASRLLIFGWTLSDSLTTSCVLELLGASSVVYWSFCLFVSLIVAFLQPAFIPTRPFSGPPHIPEEDIACVISYVSCVIF